MPFLQPSAAAVKKLWVISEKFTGLIHNTEKKMLPSFPSFSYVHLSWKPDTSALKQVLGEGGGGCHGHKVTPVGLAIHWGFLSLATWKFTWPNCQSQAFMTSKPDRIHGSCETFVRWQCAAFLKRCWHSQFASQTLATKRISPTAAFSE